MFQEIKELPTEAVSALSHAVSASSQQKKDTIKAKLDNKELRALRGYFGPPLRLKYIKKKSFFTHLLLLVYQNKNSSVKVSN